MATHESILNKALASILREKILPTRVVTSETAIGRKIADIIVTGRERLRLPVIIEAEYAPGRNVKAEANRWLDESVILEGHIHPVERVIALIYPETLKSVSESNIPAVMRNLNTKYRYCIFQGDRGGRIATMGWLEGSAADLANFISDTS